MNAAIRHDNDALRLDKKDAKCPPGFHLMRQGKRK